MISLKQLEPQFINVRIMGLTEQGEPVEIPLLTLTYIQWQNATVGLIPPEIPKKPTVPDPSKPPVLVDNPNDPEYQRKKVEYENAAKFRRVAMGLAGAGAVELQGLALDEQAKQLHGLDAGIINVLYSTLEGLALRRTGAWFQRKPEQLSESDNDNLPSDGLVNRA